MTVYCIMKTTVMIRYFDRFQYSLDCLHSADPTQERMKNRTAYITDVSTFSVTDVTPDPTDSSCPWSIVYRFTNFTPITSHSSACHLLPETFKPEHPL